MLYPLDHHAPQKKEASSTELSNTVFSHSSNVNSHIMTDAILLCNQYYSTIVHLLIIYSNILSWNNIEKTYLATWGLEPASPVSVVNRHAISSRPKKDASSTELSNTVFFPIRLMLILTS